MCPSTFFQKKASEWSVGSLYDVFLRMVAGGRFELTTFGSSPGRHSDCGSAEPDFSSDRFAVKIVTSSVGHSPR